MPMNVMDFLEREQVPAYWEVWVIGWSKARDFPWE